ncbi:hypothetical protein BASA81_001017 [Batrachochytrium salamandrivorans]|nr:hypothetical protein BASA81_001017 [Batrachochytrium salamandrivorans]
MASYRPKLAFAPASKLGEELLVSSTRPLQLHGDVSHLASGSATCELGRTKVLCQVFGPRPRKQQGKAEFENMGAVDVEATFMLSFSSGDDGLEENDGGEKANRALSMFVENALQTSVQLELFPKSVLDVHIQVLEDDGSAFACAVICASFALAKCGVEMFDLVTAVTLYSTPVGSGDEETVYVDPTKRQQFQAKATCTVAMFASTGEITALSLTSVTPNRLPQYLAKAQAVCLQVDSQIRSQLVGEEEAFVL